MKKLKPVVIVLWASAVLFILVSFSFIPKGQIGEFFTSLAMAAGLGFWGWHIYKKKPKTAAKPAPDVEQAQSSEQSASLENDEYEYETFKVAGVTFKNGRKSRQTILRKIKWQDEEFADAVTLTIKEETFEERPAIAIYANDQQIGYAPADLTTWILENWDRIVSVSNLEVNGGGNGTIGEALNYGAKVTIKLNK